MATCALSRDDSGLHCLLIACLLGCPARYRRGLLPLDFWLLILALNSWGVRLSAQRLPNDSVPMTRSTWCAPGGVHVLRRCKPKEDR